ncbi:death-associated inhibitor of apoptosis 2 isoform X2 [Prorops nasuta]|uniref:death-associated inhibitor of apoptosis 2 isoform X2 n=1 Tax=Prorops nasuta TaxID=863751 RepID=UPI0034CD6EB9
MNVEENRLRTFSDWPTTAVIDAGRVAKAGFYYTGHAQEVQCFLCGEKVSEWNYGDQAIVRHRQVSPNCPFVIDSSSTCNVPLTSITNNATIPSSSSGAASSARHVVQGNSVNIIQRQNPSEDYTTYNQRLQSFSTWPIPLIVSPERLAKSGFYYLKQADMVECVFCKGVLTKWQDGDDPDREHVTHFPACDFYMHMYSENDMLLLGNVKLVPGTTSGLNDLGIQTHLAPRQPEHATYEGRLRTFREWPEHLKQTPEMLAESGFYYVGIEDQVRCFHCDGGLRNWETTDDVWTEHAKYFPQCGFVVLVKGHEFIKKCCDERQIFAGTSEAVGEDVVGMPPSTLPAILPRNVQEVTESVLEELLNSIPAMSALEIGLQIGRVKRALKRRLELVGIPYTNANQLIEDVLHEQRMEEDASDSDTNDVLVDINETNETSESKETSEPDVIKESTSTEKDSKSSDDSSLEEENRRLKEARLCKICMDREVGVVFLPCGHLATCVHCAPSLNHCPLCRQEIRATVRTFLS